MQNLNPGFNQKISRFSVSFILAATLAILAGCSNNTTASAPGTTTTTGTATLTIVLSSNSISTNSTATVSATLKDASGAPMAGQLVTFTTDGNMGSLSQATALTGDGTGGTILGVATTILSQATTATKGAALITASVQGVTTLPVLPVGYSVAGVGGGGGGSGVTVSSVSVTATPASATADGYSLITVKATVLDAASAPIPNQQVTFTSAKGSFSLGSTATTNTSGVAQVLLLAPTIAGSTSIIALAGGIPGTALVTFVAGLPVAVGLSTTAPAIAALGNTTIVAVLTDYYGNPVGAGQTVTFGTSSITGGHFTTLPGVLANSATTDAQSQAKMIYVAGTCTGSCSDTLTANATNAAMTVTYATNLATLSVGGTVGTPTLSIGAIASPVATTATVTATLLDATATAVPNAVVTFSIADQTLATLTPANGTALTNASGKATVTLNTVNLASGATTLTASAQVGSTAVSASSGFSVGGAQVTLNNIVFGVGAGTLSAFGSTSMSTLVCIGSGAGTSGCTAGSPVSSPVTVDFTSGCASSGKAVISSSATTVNGTATGSYRDNGCAGTDTVTATVSGSSSSSGTIKISTPTIGSVQFVSASPTTISLKGIGGTETSQVTFKVVDANSNPLSGQTVSFGLSTTIGGITLTPAGTPPTAISDNNGLVVITVNAGVVSTPVRVTATTGTLTTQSSELTITTGIPDQDSFSLSASTHNIEGWTIDGTTSVLTARLADHFNNPVPDGTAVNFTTEGGSIVGSCTTIGGSCTSTFTSQALRPTNGRVTVLAYAVGEESFTDLNGNGLADTGEMKDANGTSTDMPEAFVDYNENGTYDAATEPFLDFNTNGTYDGPDGKFNGVLCSGSTICSTTKTIHVRQSQVLTLSSSYANIALFTDAAQATPATQIDLSSCDSIVAAVDTTQPAKTYYIRVIDTNGNAMPAGTTIGLTKSNGNILSSTSFVVPDSSACNKTANATCPSNSPLLGVYPLTIQSDATYSKDTNTAPPIITCTNPSNSGVLTVTVTSPKGAITTTSYLVTD